MQPKSVQRFLNQIGRRELLNYIQVFEPDLIVCTYPTISSILGQLRIDRILHVPLITVITDYTAHSHWVHPGVDRYMVACTEVREILVSLGVEERRIQVTGIPISPKFERVLDQREILNKLGLTPELPIYLIMGAEYGGLKGVLRICRKLADSLIPVQLIVVCGKNKKLYYSLEEVSSQGRNHVIPFEYVHNVEELMEVSRLIITKAGGLTTSEALTKHLPMLIFNPIPGQEEENARFIKRIGAGLVAGSEEELEQLINHFLSHPEDIELMQKRAAMALPGHSTERAVENMLQLITDLNKVRQKIG